MPAANTTTWPIPWLVTTPTSASSKKRVRMGIVGFSGRSTSMLVMSSNPSCPASTCANGSSKSRSGRAVSRARTAAIQHAVIETGSIQPPHRSGRLRSRPSPQARVNNNTTRSANGLRPRRNENPDNRSCHGQLAAPNLSQNNSSDLATKVPSMAGYGFRFTSSSVS